MRSVMEVIKFGGLDERKTFDRELTYASEMKNFRITENHTLKKREGLTLLLQRPSEITGLWSGYLGQKRCMLYTAGGELWELDPEAGVNRMIGEVGEGKNTLFEFRQRVYIKNAGRYSYYDGQTLQEVTGYVPLVAIGCTAAGEGDSFEDINMLSPWRRVQYICSGKVVTYHLPEKGVKALGSVLLNGEPCPFRVAPVSLEEGTFSLSGTPPEGSVLEIAYQMGSDRRDVILKADGVMLFGGDTDGHVFLWGNPASPNVRYHSELADGQPSAEYFPENNYTVIGDSEITDIVSQYDRQLIFTKDRAFYSYCELQTDTLGNVYASFPVYNLNGEKGSLLRNCGCIMHNEPVTLCADGLNKWSATTVENERNAVCFSDAVGNTMRELLSHGEFAQMRLFNRRTTGELFFLYGGGMALVYQYRIGAWYRYDDFDAQYLTEHGGMLYLARGNRLLRMDPNNGLDFLQPFEAVYESPYLAFHGGERLRLHRVDWTVRAEGNFSLHFSFGGEQLPPGAPVPVSSIGRNCPTPRVLSGCFRLGATAGGAPVLHRIKLRVTESDGASFCELAELRLHAIRKGRYLRNGIT